MDLKYDKYIVAHIDILGCKNTLQNRKSSEDLLNKLRKIYSHAPELIRRLSEAVRRDFDIDKDGIECSDFNIETKIFSDNICIYLKYPKSKEKYRIYIAWFLRMIAYYQYYSITKYELFTRGAVDIGAFYGDNKFIIGPALSRSYEIESNEAFAPRILICKKLKDDFLKKERSEAIPFTRKDFDKNLFVDYLMYINIHEKYPQKQLFKHRDILIRKFREAKEYKDKVKVLLAMIYHNRYCKNTNEWDIACKSGEEFARSYKLEECSIDMTKFLMKNS